MTTEDDFQAALDVHPNDWQTRLVFADWLEDRGDVRAEGYRALGALRIAPRPTSATRDHETHCFVPDDLPWGWFDAVPRSAVPSEPHHVMRSRPTRRAAEDAAALAFAKLPAARRRELLENSPAPT